jgi:nicotinic acetylcholine receptor
VELHHIREPLATNPDHIENGTDTNDFYRSVEWDIMEVPAVKDKHYYAGSAILFDRWTFKIILRRKFLFYTVNLIIPLISHAFITMLVFYLPADSTEKMSLSINILFSLTVFFLLMADTVPASSVAVPLLGQYLIFTMFLVSISVTVTVITYNVHFRSSVTHVMPDYTRKIFLYWMPRILMMRRPKVANSHDIHLKNINLNCCSCFDVGTSASLASDPMTVDNMLSNKRAKYQQDEMRALYSKVSDDNLNFLPSIDDEQEQSIACATYIANHLREQDECRRVRLY